ACESSCVRIARRRRCCGENSLGDRFTRPANVTPTGLSEPTPFAAAYASAVAYAPTVTGYAKRRPCRASTLAMRLGTALQRHEQNPQRPADSALGRWWTGWAIDRGYSTSPRSCGELWAGKKLPLHR